MKKILISLTAAALMLLMCVYLASPALAAGTAPIAENLEIKTYRNVSVGGKMSAYGPDGDVVSYEITTQPVKGKIVQGEDGSFTYTPNDNKRGKDYFGYKAVDAEGNVSQEATVIIRIEKQKKDVCYEDMNGRAEEYAAVALSENNIFTAEMIGGEYCFGPDKTVSRGEFLSMCMLTAGEPLINGVMSTGYEDVDAMPYWMQQYVATAVMRGVSGREESENVFRADEPISRNEAMSMLNRALGLKDIDYISLDSEWEPEAAQACANLSAVGIVESQTLIHDELTRAEAAQMLIKALEVVKGRE